VRRGRFAGQVVFITGASSGIGEALAREFAGAGADVALAARRVDRLARLAAEIEGLGRRALVLPCDVTADGDLERAAGRTREAFGRIDVVVANAGFGVMGPVETLTLADYRYQFETNVFGVLRTVYATLEDVKRARGRLVALRAPLQAILDGARELVLPSIVGNALIQAGGERIVGGPGGEEACRRRTLLLLHPPAGTGRQVNQARPRGQHLVPDPAGLHAHRDVEVACLAVAPGAGRILVDLG